MGNSVQSFSNGLKEHYSPDEIENLLFNKNPFLTLCPKEETVGGYAWRVPCIYAGSAGVGRNFQRAQSLAASTSTGIAAFIVSSLADTYAVAQWDRQLMKQAERDADTFIKPAVAEMDNKLRQMNKLLGESFYRSGYGEKGQISSAQTNLSTATTVQLASVADNVNFDIGMQVQFGQTLSTTNYRAGGPLSIVDVDRTNGILYFSTALSNITGLAAGDIIFLDDVGPGVTAHTRNAPYGIEAYIPAIRPVPGTLLWGQDVGLDDRLSGNRIDGTQGQPLEELLSDAVQLVSSRGGTLSHFFMNHGNYAKLLKGMESKHRIMDVDTDYAVGFSGANVMTPDGEVLCIPDMNCPPNRIFGLQLDTWVIGSAGPLVELVDDDGLTILRLPGADGYETRWASYSQLVCKAPGYNVNIQVPSAVPGR